MKTMAQQARVGVTLTTMFCKLLRGRWQGTDGEPILQMERQKLTQQDNSRDQPGTHACRLLIHTLGNGWDCPVAPAPRAGATLPLPGELVWSQAGVDAHLASFLSTFKFQEAASLSRWIYKRCKELSEG